MHLSCSPTHFVFVLLLHICNHLSVYQKVHQHSQDCPTDKPKTFPPCQEGCGKRRGGEAHEHFASGRAETATQGKSIPEIVGVKSAFCRSRSSIDFPARPRFANIWNVTETRECAQKMEENRLLKCHPEAYVFPVKMHPFYFVLFHLPPPLPSPPPPPPITTLCA